MRIKKRRTHVHLYQSALQEKDSWRLYDNQIEAESKSSRGNKHSFGPTLNAHCSLLTSRTVTTYHRLSVRRILSLFSRSSLSCLFDQVIFALESTSACNTLRIITVEIKQKKAKMKLVSDQSVRRRPRVNKQSRGLLHIIGARVRRNQRQCARMQMRLLTPTAGAIIDRRLRCSYALGGDD